MRLSPTIAIACFACLLSAGLFACREPDPVRIGFLGGLTGRASGLGASGRNGFLLAIEQANAAGGIAGRRLEAQVGDDQMDAGTAIAALQELFSKRVVAVIGPMTSQVAIAVVPEANRARVPMISPTVSTNQLSGLDDYFLRVYYSNSQAASMLAEHLATVRKSPRLAAIYDLSNRAYTEDWLRDFRGSYQKLGGEIISAVPFDSGSGTPFGTITDQALAKRPEGILLLANAVDSAMVAQQLAKRATGVQLYATGWSYTDDLLQLGGNSVEGLTIIRSADPENRTAENQNFARLYADRFREAPNFPAMHAYDATRMVIAALTAGGSTGEPLKRALLSLPPQPGVQGSLAFDRFGDLLSPELHLAVIKKGAYRSLN